jgi:hypothetical protein
MAVHAARRSRTAVDRLREINNGSAGPTRQRTVEAGLVRRLEAAHGRTKYWRAKRRSCGHSWVAAHGALRDSLAGRPTDVGPRTAVRQSVIWNWYSTVDWDPPPGGETSPETLNSRAVPVEAVPCELRLLVAKAGLGAGPGGDCRATLVARG